jgi:CubicO group peptidase (beta-lactamase class C family)
MKPAIRVLTACSFLLLLVKPALAQQPLAPDTQQRITQIESCLAYPVEIKGEPPTCQTLEDQMRILHVPGISIAVIHHGAIEWAKGFSVAKLGGDPVTADTMFQAGSVSKPVSALGVLHLVQQGKLSLDTDINKTLVSWKLPASPLAPGAIVTLRELLTHTAGLTIHGFPGYAAGEPVPTLVQVLNGEKPANTGPVRLESMPGSQWKYSGGGITVMQLMVQDVTHLPFAQFMHDTVFAPLGMSHSTFEQPLPPSYHATAATPYDESGNPIPGGAHTYPEQAAAGLWTTPSDLARYVLELQQSLQGKATHVLNQDMTRKMLTPGKGHWGLGIEIGGSPAHPYFDHDGDDAGFKAFMLGYQDSGEGLAIMTNGDNGYLFLDRIAASVAKAYGWPDLQPQVRTTIKLDRTVLARYVGTYRLEKGADATITLEGDQLFSKVDDEPRMPIYPASQANFFTLMNREFEFQSDDKGRVRGLVTYYVGSDYKSKGKRI